MPQYLFPVQYQMNGLFVVEANSLEAAVQAFKSDDPRFDPEHADAEPDFGTYENHDDLIEELTEERYQEFLKAYPAWTFIKVKDDE